MVHSMIACLVNPGNMTTYRQSELAYDLHTCSVNFLMPKMCKNSRQFKVGDLFRSVSTNVYYFSIVIFVNFQWNFIEELYFKIMTVDISLN